jgi:integrase
LHILPYASDWIVSKISIEDCQKLCDKWFNKGLVQYKRFNNYVRKVLDYAIHIGERSDNPAMFVIPQVNKERENIPSTIEYYTSIELNKLFNVLKAGNNFQAYTMIRLLAMSGLRKGEVLALNWDDINLSEGTINVNKTQSAGEHGIPNIQTPKTKQSNRVVYIDPETVKVLKVWKIKQREYLFNFGFNINKKNNFVFSNEHNEMFRPSKVGKWLNSASKKAGLPTIKVHSLRKTFATLNAEMGVDEATVQKQLGHSVGSLVTRQIYMEVTENQRKEQSEKFFKGINF